MQLRPLSANTELLSIILMKKRTRFRTNVKHSWRKTKCYNWTSSFAFTKN